jgi:phosphate transport system protein
LPALHRTVTVSSSAACYPVNDDGSIMTSHTSKQFEQELRTLRDRLAMMGRRCEQQIRRALQALTDRDDELARDVIEGDAEIDRDETEIDELALQILAARQPVARDLRLIVIAFKFVTDLERIGDHAAGIAKRALELNPLPPLQVQNRVERLATLVQNNLHAVLDAFSARDVDGATAVIEADAAIDQLNSTLFAELIAFVATDAATVTRVIPLTSVCRYLERIGDHVKNLAEDIVYMVRAQDVRHRNVTWPPSGRNKDSSS